MGVNQGPELIDSVKHLGIFLICSLKLSLNPEIILQRWGAGMEKDILERTKAQILQIISVWKVTSRPSEANIEMVKPVGFLPYNVYVSTKSKIKV